MGENDTVNDTVNGKVNDTGNDTVNNTGIALKEGAKRELKNATEEIKNQNENRKEVDVMADTKEVKEEKTAQTAESTSKSSGQLPVPPGKSNIKPPEEYSKEFENNVTRFDELVAGIKELKKKANIKEIIENNEKLKKLSFDGSAWTSEQTSAYEGSRKSGYDKLAQKGGPLDQLYGALLNYKSSGFKANFPKDPKSPKAVERKLKIVDGLLTEMEESFNSLKSIYEGSNNDKKEEPKPDVTSQGAGTPPAEKKNSRRLPPPMIGEDKERFREQIKKFQGLVDGIEKLKKDTNAIDFIKNDEKLKNLSFDGSGWTSNEKITYTAPEKSEVSEKDLTDFYGCVLKYSNGENLEDYETATTKEKFDNIDEMLNIMYFNSEDLKKGVEDYKPAESKAEPASETKEVKEEPKAEENATGSDSKESAAQAETSEKAQDVNDGIGTTQAQETKANEDTGDNPALNPEENIAPLFEEKDDSTSEIQEPKPAEEEKPVEKKETDEEEETKGAKGKLASVKEAVAGAAGAVGSAAKTAGKAVGSAAKAAGKAVGGVAGNAVDYVSETKAGKLASKAKHSASELAHSALKGQGTATYRKKKLDKLINEYNNFVKSHNALLNSVEDEDGILTSEVKEWCGKNGGSSNKWLSAVNQFKIMFENMTDADISNLHVELMKWFDNKSNIYIEMAGIRDHAGMLADIEKKLKYIIGDLWREFSDIVDDVKNYGGITADGTDFNTLKEELINKFEALSTSCTEFIKNHKDFFKNSNEKCDLIGKAFFELYDAKTLKDFMDKENSYCLAINMNMQEKYSEENNRFNATQDPAAQAKCLKKMYLLAQKAVDEIKKEAESHESPEKVLEELQTKFAELDEHYRRVLKMYPSVADPKGGEATLNAGISSQLKTGNFKTLFNERSFYDTYITSIVSPAGDAATDKFESKLRQIKKDTKISDAERLREMYDLAAKAVHYVEKVLARKAKAAAKKDEKKSKSLAGRIFHTKKTKDPNEKLQDKLDKINEADLNDTEKAALSQAAINKSASKVNVRPAFVEAAKYVVNPKMGAFKKDKLYKKIDSVKGQNLDKWKDMLKGYIGSGSSSAISVFAVAGDAEKDYKKAAVAVLLASLCGLPNSECIMQACKGLKDGGLKGGFKEKRAYLNNLSDVRKKIKVAARGGTRADVAACLNSSGVKKLFDGIVNVNKFAGVIEAFSKIEYKNGADNFEQKDLLSTGNNSEQPAAGAASTEQKKGIRKKISGAVTGAFKKVFGKGKNKKGSSDADAGNNLPDDGEGNNLPDDGEVTF